MGKINWEAIPGWFDYEDVYREWARDVPRDGVIVEVGVFCGRSLAFLANELMTLEKETVTLIGIDNWSRSVTEEMLVRNNPSVSGPVLQHYSPEAVVAKFEGYPNLKLIRGNSHDAILQIEHTANYIWLDAGHTFEEVSKDLSAAFVALGQGGTLGIHDYNEQTFPGVYNAVNKFLQRMAPVNVCVDARPGSMGLGNVQIFFPIENFVRETPPFVETWQEMPPPPPEKKTKRKREVADD